MSFGDSIKGYFTTLLEPSAAATAIRVALFVGSLLFVINHGAALLKGEMNPDRWISACLTYLVPYAVNIHGQYVTRLRLGANGREFRQGPVKTTGLHP